jgi:hypothetical protein
VATSAATSPPISRDGRKGRWSGTRKGYRSELVRSFAWGVMENSTAV